MRFKNYTIAQHHKILDAVTRKDTDAAGEAMAEHLKESMDVRFTIK